VSGIVVRVKPADKVVQKEPAEFELRQSPTRMLSFPQKICLIFATILSTDVEIIMGKSVNNARLKVGCISAKELCSQLLQRL